MKIDLSYPILDLNGSPLLEGFDVRTACVQALTSALPSDERSTGDQKVKLFSLAVKLTSTQGDEVDLTAEEISQIKSRSGQLFTPLVVGRLWSILDPASVPEA